LTREKCFEAGRITRIRNKISTIYCRKQNEATKDVHII